MTIEKMVIQVPKKAEKAAESGNGKRKRTGTLPDEKASTKKSRSSKHCELCKKHGGAKNTHNTVYCKRYKLDGPQKKSFQSKKGIAIKKSDQQLNPYEPIYGPTFLGLHKSVVNSLVL